MKKLCRDTKKIIWTICRLSTYTKGPIRQVQMQKQKEVQKQLKRQPQRQTQRQPERLLGANINFFWGTSSKRWQGRIKKANTVFLCQEEGRRSDKILQDYLHTMRGSDSWRMKPWWFTTWENSGREVCSKTVQKSTKNSRVCLYKLRWLRYQGWTKICRKTDQNSPKVPRLCWYRLRWLRYQGWTRT